MRVFCKMLSIFVLLLSLFDFEGGIRDQAPKVIKLFSCSTQLSMKFLQLINVKMPTIVGILTFRRRKNNILGLSEPK